MDLSKLLIWPFLILVIGLVFISFSDLGYSRSVGYSYYPFGSLSWLIIFLLIIFFAVRPGMKGVGLEGLRQKIVIFSIALLLPILVRYLVLTANKELAIIIVGLVLGFLTVIWGMFIKNHSVLTYANIIGGALTLLYVYSQLWSLGEVARIIAAAVGLVIAVAVSVIKLREKLAS